jgi:hypothetical protein
MKALAPIKEWALDHASLPILPETLISPSIIWLFMQHAPAAVLNKENPCGSAA